MRSKIRSTSAIPPEERTRQLLADAKAGNSKARDRLVKDSMPLVESVVSKQRRPDLHDDLVQAGLVGSSEGQGDGEPAKAGGLLRAIELWDETRGVRWSTFATWWIRAGVQAELCKQGPLLGPNRRALKRRAKVRKAAAALEARLNRQPTTDEIADSLKVPERTGIIEAAMRPLPKPLREATGEPAGRRVWEELRSGATPTPEQALDLQRMLQRIRDAVKALPPIERVVVAGTFGIEARELPQEALCKVAGLSDRVLRQVKKRALERLKKQLVDLETGRVRGQDLEDPVCAGESTCFGELDGQRKVAPPEMVEGCMGRRGSTTGRDRIRFG